VKVKMSAGPFEVDADHESVLKSGEWRDVDMPAG
jgi:hypothetical protein